MELQDIEFIVNHSKLPVFPRTISTKLTQRSQIRVNTIQEAYARFKQADFIDCRINAYPIYADNYQGADRLAPSLVMCDLDQSNFKTEKLLMKTLRATLTNIATDLGELARPTVLFTGNGYHVYQPIRLPVLEAEHIFERFDRPSTQFIRYAAKKWTQGKNDPCNYPSVNSCMLRVPNSINSKNGKTVSVVQWWNGVRPAANDMLPYFKIQLVDAKLKYDYKHGRGLNKLLAGGKVLRISLRESDYKNVPQTIHWIDKAILDGPGIGDYRKTTISLVLAPYLINVKKENPSTAYGIIMNWLVKCNKIRSLDFNARNKVSYAINHAFPYPMRQDTMQSKYPEMYEEIFNHGGLT
jgi:Primase X